MQISASNCTNDFVKTYFYSMIIIYVWDSKYVLNTNILHEIIPPLINSPTY